MTPTSFASLGLPASLLTTLDSLNFQQMTPIQAQSLPAILAGRDLIAQAQTGSGKTAAFALGLLAQLDVKRFRVQSLILCPTRELADQVATDIRTLARNIHNIKVLTLCGGVPARSQIISLEHGAHIIVGTPGRVLDHLEQQRLDLSELKNLVLDEADRMLEMGFSDALTAIISNTPAQRQTLLFSATYPKDIQQLASTILTEPLSVQLASIHNEQSIQQQFFQLEAGSSRPAAVSGILLHFQPTSCVVFCNTKLETQELYQQLQQQGFSVLALHGDLEQKDRDLTLLQFANNSACVLVATDVAARGLDIEKLDLVVNYQLAHDVDTHVHRIGRTGRAGSQGMAISLVGEQDGFKLGLIEDHFGSRFEAMPLPAANGQQRPARPSMVTLQIEAGKKQKLRPADIVGALTRDNALEFAQIGKIQLQENRAFVAVAEAVAKKALQQLQAGPIKGRQFRVYRL